MPPFKQNHSRPILQDILLLLGSMRFAISLLVIIGIGSAIGTILKQGEPYNNYLNQFGPFWFQVFATLSLYNIYESIWFLSILGFLVVSVSLCIYRNAPKMLSGLKDFRWQLKESTLRALPHQQILTVPTQDKEDKSTEFISYPSIVQAITLYWKKQFSQIHTQGIDAGTYLISARKGRWGRLGYLFTHAGIVVICVGGLLDSSWWVRWQLQSGNKSLVMGNPLLSEVPDSGRLGIENPSFRANLYIPEGQQRSHAIITRDNGFLLQTLPFDLKLKQFVTEQYSSGQPKRFASEVTLIDKENQSQHESWIEVNHPLIYRGITIYQSGFDDGGSALRMTALPIMGQAILPFPLIGRNGDTLPLSLPSDASPNSTLEITEFRRFNIEPLTASDITEPSTQKETPLNLQQRIKLGSAVAEDKIFQNRGPSFRYKIRDTAGQAREYNNYMLPVLIDDSYYWLSGVRSAPNEPFRYLKLPADEQGTLNEWVRIRRSLQNTQLRSQVGKIIEAQMQKGESSSSLPPQFNQIISQLLAGFMVNGFQGMAEFIERSVPVDQRERMALLFIQLLRNATWEAWQLQRLQDGLPRLPKDSQYSLFVQDSLNAISDSFFYGSSVYIRLDDFDELKASIFQVTRSPGKIIVYWGCLFLVLGIFGMFYLREERHWVLLKPDGSILYTALFPRHHPSDAERFANQGRGLQSMLNQTLAIGS